MVSTLTVIYDDRAAPNADIEAAVGATRYSNILRCRVSLGEQVRANAAKGGADDFFHLVDDRDTRYLIDVIEASPVSRVFLWLPSFMMPANQSALGVIVRKARYALESILLMPIEDGEAARILTASDTLAFLRARTDDVRRTMLQEIGQNAGVMTEFAPFWDLRKPEAFLQFMSGATEARYFNAMQADGAIYRKSSTDIEKMRKEYRFFHIAPENLKPFLVPTFGYYEDGARAGYAMERMAIPDVALQHIHQALDETSFSVLLDRFFAFIKMRPHHDIGASAVRDVARKSILQKMTDRLDVLSATSEGRKLAALLCDAGPQGSLEELAARATAVIEKAIDNDPTDYLAVGHGDPCFSNMLFDRRTGVFRLVDPKGADRIEEAWMHPLYDIAKLSHSVLGCYDFVNNNLFECNLDNDMNLSLVLDRGGTPAWCRDLFKARLAAEGYDYAAVRAIELSLFLSMLPLHRDHPRKLLGFVLIAGSILRDIEALS